MAQAKSNGKCDAVADIAAARLDERACVARDLHDEIGGNLAGIKMALAVLARNLPTGSADLRDKATYLDVLVDRTIAAVHRLSENLAPESLQHGLISAIRWQAEQFARQSEIPCGVVANEPNVEHMVDTEQSIALLRILQEALTNIAKHAQAKRVQVRLLLEVDHLRLEVEDDGKGMPADYLDKVNSLGIRGMMARAQNLGGKVSLQSVLPQGTQLAFTLPLNKFDTGV